MKAQVIHVECRWLWKYYMFFSTHALLVGPTTGIMIYAILFDPQITITSYYHRIHVCYIC